MSSANIWGLILVPEVRDNIVNSYRCLFTFDLKCGLSSCKKEISNIDDHGVIIASDKNVDFWLITDRRLIVILYSTYHDPKRVYTFNSLLINL